MIREIAGRFWIFLGGTLLGLVVAFWSVPACQAIVAASIIVPFGMAALDVGWWPAHRPERGQP